MKFFIIISVLVSIYIAISHSNPNLLKGEIMKDIITKQTQGNYEEAINLFAIIGKLAQNNTVDLSDREQKLFFDCYHYRHIQLQKNLLIPVENVFLLNRTAKEFQLLFYDLIHEITQDFDTGSTLAGKESNYYKFFMKVMTDRLYFESRYKGNIIDEYGVKISFKHYIKVLEELKTFLSDADPSVLDACLGLSIAKLEYETMNMNDVTEPPPCRIAQNCIVKGRDDSSESNPDLIPLLEFVSTYCKPDAPNILEQKIIYAD